MKDIKMNVSISIFKISDKQRYYIEQVHYFSLLLLVLVLPYWGAWKLMKLLVLVIFISSLFSGRVNLKALLSNKVILALFSFILFTSISVLWSSSEILYNEEYKLVLLIFKYYLLLVFGIYFSSLSKKRIKNIFFMMAIAPIGTACVYYLNAFGITDIYTVVRGGNSRIFLSDLVNNFFLLYSSIYFLHLSLTSFFKKQYPYFTLFFMLFILFVSSLLIDPPMSSRLMLLVFAIVAFITFLFYLKGKYSIVIIVLFSLVITVFMNTNTSMKLGINEFKTAIEEKNYSGSWGLRLGLAIAGVDIFKEHPVIGRGVNNVRVRVGDYLEDNSKSFMDTEIRHFHNEHLNILVEVGMVGYFLYLLFIFLFLRIPLSDPLINKLKYTYTIAFLLLQMGEHYLMFPAASTSFFICIFFILTIRYGELEK